MSSLFLSILLVMSALLAPNAAAESQPVQSFFLMRPSGGDAADRNALETCAARFSSALTNASGFRESQDAETQTKVSECLQESASGSAWAPTSSRTRRSIPPTAPAHFTSSSASS